MAHISAVRASLKKNKLLSSALISHQGFFFPPKMPEVQFHSHSVHTLDIQDLIIVQFIRARYTQMYFTPELNVSELLFKIFPHCAERKRHDWLQHSRQIQSL